MGEQFMAVDGEGQLKERLSSIDLSLWMGGNKIIEVEMAFYLLLQTSTKILNVGQYM